MNLKHFPRFQVGVCEVYDTLRILQIEYLSVSVVHGYVDVLLSVPDTLALGRQQKPKLFLHICNCCLYCLTYSRGLSLRNFYLDICHRLWTVKSRAYRSSIFNSKPYASTSVYFLFEQMYLSHSCTKCEEF